MGLCKEEKDASQYRFMSICDRYESVIEQCTGENQEGNLDIEYVTIRCIDWIYVKYRGLLILFRYISYIS